MENVGILFSKYYKNTNAFQYHMQNAQRLWLIKRTLRYEMPPRLYFRRHYSNLIVTAKIGKIRYKSQRSSVRDIGSLIKQLDDYEFAIACLQGIINSHIGCSFLFGGDFNVSKHNTASASSLLGYFCEKNNLCWIDADVSIYLQLSL